ncbi:MAG: LPS-assembly protein LptD [Thermodesulfobacteriota bacterium]
MPQKRASSLFFLLLALLHLVLLFLLLPYPGSAQELLQPTKIDQQVPWVLFSQDLQVDQELKIVEASGDVELRHQNNLLQSDYARYYWETGWVYLKGNVYAELDQDLLWAQEAEIDLQSRTGWLKQGRIFMPEPNLHVQGQNLQKTGEETYEFEQARVTTCDGDNPPWSLYTAQGRVTLEGYAHLDQPRFRIKDQTVLYSPYLILPTKRTRQSGFLRPEYSTSTRDGTGINLPYFQVIDQEQDLTFYMNYMSKRGFMPGLEYRLTPDPLSKGLFKLDWVHDQVRYDSNGDIDADNYPKDRFWLRSKLDGYFLKPEWKLLLDLDYVSDEYYLREFKNGYSGFEQSREEFLQEFGRDVADKDSKKRTSQLLLSRSWSNIGLQSRLEYNQDPTYQRKDKAESEDDTLQRLPEINLDIYRSYLGQSDFQFEANNQATYFWRRADEVQGLRLDMHPRLLLPLRSGFGTILPSMGWRQTLYFLQDTPDDMDSQQERGIWDLNIDASSELMRIFDLGPAGNMQRIAASPGNSAWTMIRHSLRPELDYSYIPDQEDEQNRNLPRFDSQDRIQAENEITYALDNIFTRRKDTIRKKTEGPGFNLDQDYLDFLEFKLEQSYDFNEADREENLDQYPKRPFSDIKARLLLRPFSWLHLRNSTWVSPYTGDINEHEHMLRLKAKDLAEVYFGLDYNQELEEDIHRKNQDDLRILRTGGRLNLRSWSLFYDLEQDLLESELIEQRIGLRYDHQCWDVQLVYEKTQDEDRVEVMFSLYQLGDIEQALFAESRD